MNAAVLIAAFVVFGGCATAPPARDAAAEVTRVARARSAALVARDRAALEAILHPRFVYTNASGEILDRETYLARYVASPEVRWHAQELEDVVVRVHGATAVLTGRVHDVASFGEQRLDARFRTTFVYVSTATGWRCLAGHTSELSR